MDLQRRSRLYLEVSYMEPTEPIIPTPEREPAAGERFSYDLDRVNAVIVDMLTNEATNPADLEQAWAVRALLAETFVDSLEETPDNPTKRFRVQFDIMVDKAIIFETVGNELRYLEDIDSAAIFAIRNKLNDVIDSIAEELDEKTKEIGNSPREIILKLRGHVSTQNREYLRDLVDDDIDYEDFIGTVYGMILEEGDDPDEVMAQLGLTE